MEEISRTSLEQIIKNAVSEAVKDIDGRLANIENRLDGMDNRLTNVESGLKGIGDRLDSIEEMLGTIQGDVEQNKTDMAPVPTVICQGVGVVVTPTPFSVLPVCTTSQTW